MTYQRIKKATLYIGAFVLLFFSSNIKASHINKVFHDPLSSRTIFNKRTSTNAALFFSHAYKGYDHNDKKSNILAIDGTYNLKAIVSALKLFNIENNNPTYVDPLFQTNSLYSNRDLVYDVASTIRTCGITLSHEQALFKSYLSIGASLPILYLNTLSKVSFSKKNSNNFFAEIHEKVDPTEWHQIEVARRTIHQELGLKGNLWSSTSIGDLNFYLAGQYTFDYTLLCKEIQLTCRLGCIAPTGIQRDDNYLSSVAFGNEGFWSIYAVTGFQAILKKNLHIGCLTSLTIPFAKTIKNRRISILEEADFVSPLKKDLHISPGVAFSISPHVIFENLLDGVHFQVQYSYLQHSKQTISELENDETIKSYLTRTPDAHVSADQLKDARKIKKNNKWHDHYISFEALYNPKDALRNWWADPHFYILYNYPLGGRGAAFNHQVSLGMTLHF